MKLIFLIWLAWLMAMPVQAWSPQPPGAPLVADEDLQGHLDYLASRLRQRQFAAMDSLLASLPLAQREYLLCRLLTGLNVPTGGPPSLLAWVQTQAAKAPQWLVERERDGFLIQQPAYDFAAEARLALARWQQQVWQENYRQLLAQDKFEFKQIYNSRNRDISLQQQALLAVLAQQPLSLLRRQARRLATMSIFLPDNQLLLQLVARTGDPGLYLKLWRQPVDHDSVAALATVSRFYQGQQASDLLIAASRNRPLKIPALHQLSQISPLPARARQLLLAELGQHQYSGRVASLLLQINEPRLLAQLADRLVRPVPPPAEPIMLPDTTTPTARPGL